MHPGLKGAALRAIEDKILYDYHKDEQYVLDDEAYGFLRHCTGRNSFSKIIEETGSNAEAGRELVSFLKKEGLLEDRRDIKAPEKLHVLGSPKPSLRYLQLHITEKCNLDCKHCYLGKKGNLDLDTALVKKAIREFSDCGLKLLVTGGEPLLHEHFWEILSYAREFTIRVELLSNGTLITQQAAERLAEHVDCVQISLDGLEESHDLVRGRGSFTRTLAGIENAAKYLQVSVATMIHSRNIHEFPALEKLVKNLGAAEWSIDVPSEKGNMLVNKDLSVDYAAASKIFMNYGYGSGVHGGDGSYSCGSHICSIDVHGEVSKCGFFAESVGNIADTTLLELWERITKRYIPKLSELECRGCEAIKECRGGCRYRAKITGGFLGKDPFMCRLYQKA